MCLEGAVESPGACLSAAIWAAAAWPWQLGQWAAAGAVVIAWSLAAPRYAMYPRPSHCPQRRLFPRTAARTRSISSSSTPILPLSPRTHSLSRRRWSGDGTARNCGQRLRFWSCECNQVLGKPRRSGSLLLLDFPNLSESCVAILSLFGGGLNRAWVMVGTDVRVYRLPCLDPAATMSAVTSWQSQGGNHSRCRICRCTF